MDPAFQRDPLVEADLGVRDAGEGGGVVHVADHIGRGPPSRNAGAILEGVRAPGASCGACQGMDAGLGRGAYLFTETPSVLLRQ